MPDVSTAFTASVPTSPPIPSSPPSAVAPPRSDTDNLKSSDTDAPEILKAVNSDTLRDHDPSPVAAQPPPAAHQSTPDQSTPDQSTPDQCNSAIAPSVVPAMPQSVSASMDTPSDVPIAPVNLRPRSKNRPGRPPNINENSLMRRLECIMAVDTGRMAMSEACQHYDISAQEDFRNGPPPAERVALSDQIHRMPPATVSDLHSNLPHLPQQPAIAAQSPPNSVSRHPVVFAQPMALKRRMPRIPHYSYGYNDRGLMQSQIYHRNTTKMPTQTPAAAEEPQRTCNGRPVARRKSGSTLSPGNDIDVRESNPLYHLPDTDEGPMTPNLETCKRRKISRSDSVILDDAVDDVLEVHPNQSFVGKCANQGSANGNGNIPNEQSQPQSSPEDSQTKAANYPDAMGTVNNGVPDSHSRALDLSASQSPMQFVECNQKHKIEIVSGQKRVNIAWYHGATSADIKEAIARRFSLVPGTPWSLVDTFSDEIIVSDGMPSGRYHLTVFP